MILGSESGCPGLQKQAFGMEGIAKINFRRNWISCDFRIHFLRFLWPWDYFFCHLRVLEAGLKFYDVSVIPWETPG